MEDLKWKNAMKCLVKKHKNSKVNRGNSEAKEKASKSLEKMQK
jgi:hypothetical protein